MISSGCTKSQCKIFICDRCLCYFLKQTKLDEHIRDCFELNKCKIKIPDENNKWLSFKNFQKQLEVPFIIYADIESMLIPIEDSDLFNDEKPKGAYQEHIPYSTGYYLHCRFDNSKSVYRSKIGTDCVTWFADELFKIATDIIEPVLQANKNIIITEEEEVAFQIAKICSICNKTIFKNEKKVRDHSHITGMYRGAAHLECNLKYQESRHVPVVFHNLGYDMHFLIEILSNQFKGRIDIIPINKEKYISFTKCISDASPFNKNAIKLKFIDSFKFMPSKLEKLASYLPKEDYKITKKEYQNDYSNEEIELLTKKGVFPYDFIDTWEKLNVTELPPKNLFYNKLNDSDITDDDYQYAQHIWTIFNIKTMSEYSELYLKTDVLLLADIFENFRDSILNIYKLDPAQYYTLPGLSWDAMLKYTRVRIELQTDMNMLLFIEKGKLKHFVL